MLISNPNTCLRFYSSATLILTGFPLDDNKRLSPVTHSICQQSPFILKEEHSYKLTLPLCAINQNVISYVSSQEFFSHPLTKNPLLTRIITSIAIIINQP